MNKEKNSDCKVVEIRLQTGQPAYPDVAREVTARLLDKIQQPSLFSAFFHYHHQDGILIPSSGIAPIAFGSYSKGFSILAINETGREILRSALPYIVEVWRNHLNRPIFIDTLTHQVSARVTPFNMRYRLKKVVLCRRKEHIKRIDPNIPKEIRDNSLAFGIKRTLIDYAEAVGLDISGKEKLFVKLIKYNKTFVSKKKASDPKSTTEYSQGYKDLEFDINAELNGIWMMGYYRSNGYGHLKTELSKKNILDQKVEAALAYNEAEHG